MKKIQSITFHKSKASRINDELINNSISTDSIISITESNDTITVWYFNI